MVDHLAAAGLRHWDPAMRQLAARALGALVPAAPLATRSHMTTGLVDALVAATADVSLEVRDGAVWGLAELVAALPRHGNAIDTIDDNNRSRVDNGGVALDAERQRAVAAVPGQLQAAHFLAGKGGETLRVAACHFIASSSRIGVALDGATAATWLEVVESSLTHPAPPVQQAATQALPCLVMCVGNGLCVAFVAFLAGC